MRDPSNEQVFTGIRAGTGVSRLPDQTARMGILKAIWGAR